MPAPADSIVRSRLPAKFVWAAAGLVLAFAVPLFQLVRFAVADDLHSYIVLIPFISLYLGWLDKNNLPAPTRPARLCSAFFFTLGIVLLGWRGAASALPVVDTLTLSTLAFVCLLVSLGSWFLGDALMKALAFPFGLLIFLVPFPTVLNHGIETFLQASSAEVADWMFQLSGLPVFRQGMQFRLPGITIQVAPECSGMHSTVVLFIVSLVAGRLLLRQTWRRAALTLFVVPLALVRNAFRIFVISQLCVHIGPHMIDSPIHHHGGPLFFMLSLLPFFTLLYFLGKPFSKSLAAPAVPPSP